MGLIKHLLLRMGGLSETMSVEFSAGPKLDSDSSINAVIEGGNACPVISFSHLWSSHHQRMRFKWGLHIAKENRRMGQDCLCALWYLALKRQALLMWTERASFVSTQITETLDPPQVIIVFIFITLNLPNKCRTASTQDLVIWLSPWPNYIKERALCSTRMSHFPPWIHPLVFV